MLRAVRSDTVSPDGRASFAPRRYSIPRGGAFEFVSSPHYLFDALVYVSFLVLLPNASVSVWALLVWVTCNLAITAHRTHLWCVELVGPWLGWVRRRLTSSRRALASRYRERFGDAYPARRRKLIPFLW